MSKTFATFLVTLTAFFWGTNFNAGKIVVSTVSPVTAAAIRFGMAAVIMLVLMLPQLAKLKKAVRQNYCIFIMLGLIGVAGFNSLSFFGLKFTSAINGALIMATNPILTVLLSALLLNIPITHQQKIGMLISFFGVLIVITHGSWQLLVHLRISIGDAIIMLGNIFWALYGVLNRKYVKDSTPLITTTASVTIGAFVMIIIASFETPGFASVLHQTWQIYALLIYMGICGSTLAYIFWNLGVEHLGANHTSLFFNLVPVFTALVAAATGSPIQLLQVIGGALVIGGVMVSMNTRKLTKS